MHPAVLRQCHCTHVPGPNQDVFWTTMIYDGAGMQMYPKSKSFAFNLVSTAISLIVIILYINFFYMLSSLLTNTSKLFTPLLFLLQTGQVLLLPFPLHPSSRVESVVIDSSHSPLSCPASSDCCFYLYHNTQEDYWPVESHSTSFVLFLCPPAIYCHSYHWPSLHLLVG